MIYVRLKSAQVMFVVDDDYAKFVSLLGKLDKDAFIDCEALSGDETRFRLCVAIDDVSFVQETTPEDVKKFWEHLKAQAEARGSQLARPQFMIPPLRPKGN